MKIAFASVYDLNDVRRGSGTFHYLFNTLKAHGHTLCNISPLHLPREPMPTRLLRSLTHRIWRGRYVTYLDPFISHARGKIAEEKIRATEAKIILTSDYGIAAGLSRRLPVVIYTDDLIPADYPANVSPFSRVANIPVPAAWLFQQTTRRAIQNCALLVYPSEWQIYEAMKYGASKEKTRVIPFGANIPAPDKSVSENKTLLDEKNILHLLFVGKDWKRKGGDIALQTAEVLRARGLQTEIHLVGAEISNIPSFVHTYGNLDKSNQHQAKILYDLYTRCAVLILPSQAEGSAIVPREAAAFGMPTLGYDIRGMQTSIRHNQSGILLPLSASASDFANILMGWAQSPETYTHLSQGSHAFYRDFANWENAIQKLTAEMENMT